MYWPYDITAANAPISSPWRIESMKHLKLNRSIISKYKKNWRRRGSNDQYDHDNEASAIRENHDITLHKTLENVQVPENNEKWRDLDKLCHVGIDIK